MAKILVIDDDAQIRALLTRILATMRHEVVCASDGKAGLSEFRRSPFDLVITDIIMPDQEGIETIIGIKKSAPATKIIAISGGGRVGAHDFLHIAERLGANLTLQKPIRAADLVAAVSSVLAQETTAG